MSEVPWQDMKVAQPTQSGEYIIDTKGHLAQARYTPPVDGQSAHFEDVDTKGVSYEFDEINRWIAVPPFRPQPEWVPITELPKEDGLYLVCFWLKGGGGGGDNFHFSVKDQKFYPREEVCYTEEPIIYRWRPSAV